MSNSSLSPWILFVSCPKSLRSYLRVMRLRRVQTAENRRDLRRSFPLRTIVTTMSNLAVNALVRTKPSLYTKLFSSSFPRPTPPPPKKKLDLKILIGNHIHVNLTRVCGFQFSLKRNSPPPPPPLTNPIRSQASSLGT